MARVQINYPQPMAPVDPVATAPAGPTYAEPPVKTYRNSLKLLPFGMFPAIPFGPTRSQSMYDQTDPAVRALYGLDDPNRNKPAATAATAPTGATTPEKVYTPYTNYGVNDSGRTLDPNPNPSFALNTTLGAAGAPSYPSGSGTPSRQGPGGSNPTPTGSASDPFGGFLGGLLSLFGIKKPGEGEAPYEAALRERPDDIQKLVSMTRRPAAERGQNYGGFLGGMFDEPKG